MRLIIPKNVAERFSWRGLGRQTSALDKSNIPCYNITAAGNFALNIQRIVSRKGKGCLSVSGLKRLEQKKAGSYGVAFT